MFDDLIAAAVEVLFGYFDDDQGEGMGIEGDGLGVNGGGSSCIDLDPLYM